MVGGTESMFYSLAKQITGKRWRRNKMPIEVNGQFETDDVLNLPPRDAAILHFRGASRSVSEICVVAEQIWEDCMDQDV